MNRTQCHDEDTEKNRDGAFSNGRERADEAGLLAHFVPASCVTDEGPSEFIVVFFPQTTHSCNLGRDCQILSKLLAIIENYFVIISQTDIRYDRLISRNKYVRRSAMEINV